MAIAPWPELNVERDSPTFALLHLASQMLGKIRVAHAPWLNHGWHVALQPRDPPPSPRPLLAPRVRGKTRVAHAPWLNPGWHVALQPRANGLETLPTAAGDGRTFTLVLDLCRHAIVLWVSD